MLAERRRSRYDIHACGQEIVRACAKKPPEGAKCSPFAESCGTACFYDIVKGKEAFEICRYFLASLQMANDGNVDISIGVNCVSSPSHIGGDILLEQLVLQR